MAYEPKPGAFVHVEFAVKDPNRVKKFYGELFGWKFQDFPEMNYSTFDTPSGPGGGVRTLQEGEAPGILNYILVPSIEEIVGKIQTAGGKILFPKEEVPGMGWLAWFEDPAGTKMALWQPGPRREE
jgi:hypothetical protein